jgi:hypothetical protein
MPTHNAFRHAGLPALATAILLSGCATPLPKVASPSLGYSVTSVVIEADQDESGLASALSNAIGGAAPLSGRSAVADVTIDVLRYDSTWFGLFYGGRNHASASVRLKQADGSAISSFVVRVGDDGPTGSADAALGRRMAQIIAAKAAASYPPMAPKPKALVAQAAPVIEPVEAEPLFEGGADLGGEPCVIGTDGRCLPL